MYNFLVREVVKLIVIFSALTYASCESTRNVASTASEIFEDCSLLLSNILDVDLIKRGEFKEHFASWLKENGYDELLREKSTWSSFGGLEEGEKVSYTPTIFVHGNSDSALGYSKSKGRLAEKLTGWSKFIKSYLRRGLNMGELYGITIGDPHEKLAPYQVHNYENVMRLRLLIHAVSEYTKLHGNPSGKVNIVAHSMGNTLALKAILGGVAYDIDGELGTNLIQGGMKAFKRRQLRLPDGNSGSIAERVRTFVGIAGATKGLDACKGIVEIFIPTCNELMGLAPTGKIVEEINKPGQKFADRVYDLYSTNDQILGTSNDLNRRGGISSSLPNSDKDFVYEGEDHFEVKDKHIRKIFNLLYGH